MQFLRFMLYLGLFALICAGCGKDSHISRTEGPDVSIEFGDGVEIVSPSGTTSRLFDQFTPTTFAGRPAIGLKELVGTDLVTHPDLYGYRFIGTDGFYANMPGKGYGDNTWAQLNFGYLDLTEFKIIFQTENDKYLRKGHNVKWLIQVQLLRSVDIRWPEGRKLSPVDEIATSILSADYADAGSEAIALTSLVSETVPDNIDPSGFIFRVSARDGSDLPRLLTWEELGTAFYLPDSDLVVMPAALGSAYQLEQLQRVSLEGEAR